MASLFEPFALREVTFPNRIAVSPMCEYSSEDGLADEWHFVHLGSRAVGGAGLVMTEATAVLPEGRISPQDLGIWSDRHIEPLRRITRFVHEQGSVAGMQLAHADARRARTGPGMGVEDTTGEGGWSVVAPARCPSPRAIPSRWSWAKPGSRRS